MTEYIEKHWREVNSRNSCKGENFGKGVKDWKFSVGQGYGFIPSQSYFRVELKIQESNANPTRSDNVTFADNVCGNLWNNIYFNVGSQTMSYISNGCPQLDILKSRLTKNPSYNKTIGVAQGLNGRFHERHQQLFREGDAINQLEYDFQDSKFLRSFIWQPSLGIFDYSLPMGSGEYEIQMNPSTDYATACIDSGIHGDKSTTAKIEVEDVRFYACMCRVNQPSSGEETIHLMEMELMSTNLPINVNTAMNYEFTVPSSTRALTMFIQDMTAGKNTTCPPSRFTPAYPNHDQAMNMQDYQIEYANMTKPTIRINSQYYAGVNLMYQRYVSTALESGQFFQLTGCETFDEWCERGPIYHETFMKSADNLSTRAHVVGNFGATSSNCRLFLVSHYSRTIKIIRQNGLIVSVTSASI